MTNVLQRVPKWAWLVAGGIAAGGVALRVLGGRDDESENETADAADQYAMEEGYYGTGSQTGAPGVIVPPVIIPADNGGGGDGGSVADPLGYLPDLLDFTTALLANGGSAPAPASQVPTPIYVTVPQGPTPTATNPGAPKPCCKYNGKTLSQWQNDHNGKAGSKRRWRWPDGGGHNHTRAFAGNKACDGGGSGGGSKRNC